MRTVEMRALARGGIKKRVKGELIGANKEEKLIKENINKIAGNQLFYFQT
ncbi:MAG: hypothetical protein JRJ49_09345 [Deltaproteobacteria bacterium]|nr:hypothetical protein [Deltaproteobacteria bacterium]